MKPLRSGLLFALTIAAAVAALPFGCATSVTPSSSGGHGGTGGVEPTTGGTGGTGGMADSGPPGSCTMSSQCTAFGDACNMGACINGMCGKLPANNGAACEDGKQCTQNDTCLGGVCM